MARTIALLTDFGVDDIYAGVVKGVINAVDSAINVMDISHSVRPHAVAHGAFLLYAAFEYFAPGTVFCVVVDPGVGSTRDAVAVKTGNYCFVGPDNGVLWPAARKDGIKQIVTLTNKDFFLEAVSATFHGRDIFAPVSAHIARGVPLSEMGMTKENLLSCALFDHEVSEKSACLKILHIDRFGNLVTNMRFDDIRFLQEGAYRIRINSRSAAGIFTTYAAAPENALFIIKGSSGFMEISVKNRSAADFLGAAVESGVSVTYEHA